MSIRGVVRINAIWGCVEGQIRGVKLLPKFGNFGSQLVKFIAVFGSSAEAGYEELINFFKSW